MQRIVRQDVQPLARRASWASEKLARIIDAGLVRDRGARTPNASTLAAKLLEAFPDAASRPSMHASVPHPTDVSELGPAENHAASAPTGSPPGADMLAPTARALQSAPLPREASPAPGTLAPPSSEQPPSSDPTSSRGEDVEIFARNRDLPSELIALRTRRKK
jgi:hypothetical protein